MKRAILMVMVYGTLSSGTVQADDVQVEHGRAVFNHWCQPCHGDGGNYPGTTALAARYQGAVPAALDQRTDMPDEFIRAIVRNGISIMPFFRKTEVSDVDLAAISAYLRRNAE